MVEPGRTLAVDTKRGPTAVAHLGGYEWLVGPFGMDALLSNR